MDLKQHIRRIPDFPKKGVVFRDITTLLQNSEAFRYTIDKFSEYFKKQSIDTIVGIESRGFIFAAPLAYKLGTEFAIVRKKGKLPYKIVAEEYELEYGKDRIEMHEDAIEDGQTVLFVDDLLATGGTMLAAARLVDKLGGDVVGMGFVVELDFLKGREKLLKYNPNYDILSLVHYKSEKE
ncbi:TPA: adenine phosphoribosyltransferase [archaeon]|nr:adenine phosphoribosyltransferase [Candidatus Naiadarchaeales archaeon SRR2090153.bin1042]